MARRATGVWASRERQEGWRRWGGALIGRAKIRNIAGRFSNEKRKLSQRERCLPRGGAGAGIAVQQLGDLTQAE